jgi:hypothetical protein
MSGFSDMGIRGNPRTVVASVAFAAALASRLPKASASGLSPSEKRGFSPWGMPSSPNIKCNEKLQQAPHDVARPLQRRIERPDITPASFGKIRPPTTLTSDLRRQRPHNLSRLHSRCQILRHTNNQ